jgi:FixJ family two-component response regulator
VAEAVLSGGHLGTSQKFVKSVFFFYHSLLAMPACKWPSPPRQGMRKPFAKRWSHNIIITVQGRPMPTGASSEEQPVVFIVDDDAALRDSLEDLLRSVGLEVRTFGSAQAFLQSKRPDAPGCLVLDVRMPGQSGLEFQRTLAAAGIHIPVIFISGHGDIPMTVQAMKSGAIEFLTKPLREQDLLDAIQLGIENDRVLRQTAKTVVKLQERLDSLTPREREILKLILAGQLNKQIAAHLSLSEATVKVHRSQIMHKMQAHSLVDLLRMASAPGVSLEKPRAG